MRVQDCVVAFLEICLPVNRSAAGKGEASRRGILRAFSTTRTPISRIPPPNSRLTFVWASFVSYRTTHPSYSKHVTYAPRNSPTALCITRMYSSSLDVSLWGRAVCLFLPRCVSSVPNVAEKGILSDYIRRSRNLASYCARKSIARTDIREAAIWVI